MKGSIDIKKYVVPNLPYVMMFWFFSKIAEGYRLSAGTDAVTKAMAAVSGLGATITANPLPSFHPRDLLIGIAGAAAVRADNAYTRARRRVQEWFRQANRDGAFRQRLYSIKRLHSFRNFSLKRKKSDKRIARLRSVRPSKLHKQGKLF